MKKLIATLTIAAAGFGLYAAPPADAAPTATWHCVTRAVPRHPHSHVQVCWTTGQLTSSRWGGPGTLVFTRTITRGTWGGAGTRTGTTTITR